MTNITLNGTTVALDSATGNEFIRDATRAAEGVIDDIELQEKFDLTAEDLQKLAANKAVARSIREERARRLRSGLAVREAAQKEFIQSPKIMGEILADKENSPRHRIEASRELRSTAFSADDRERPIDTERFLIRIDISGGSGDSEHIIEHQFDKPLTKIETDDDVIEAPEQPKPVGRKPKLVVDRSNDE